MANYFISRTGKKSTFSEDANGNLNIQGIVADSEQYDYEKNLKVVVLDSDNVMRVTKLKGQSIQSHDSDKIYELGEIIDYNDSLWKAAKRTVHRSLPTGNSLFDSEWIQVAGAGGDGLNQYDSDAYWEKDDAVVYLDSIYLANSDKIGNGAPFSIAASGDNTWRPATSGGLLPANGQVFVPAPSIDVTSSQVILSIDLPSAGTYEINYKLHVTNMNNSTFNSADAWVRRQGSSDALPGSVNQYSFVIGPTVESINQDATFIYEATGPETLELFGGYNAFMRIWGSGLGNSGLRYSKISGYLPAIGYASAHKALVQLSDVAIPANGSAVGGFTEESGSGTALSLSSGDTITVNLAGDYEISAKFAPTLSSSGFTTFGIFHNGVEVGSRGLITSSDSAVLYGDAPEMSAIIQAAVGDTIQVRKIAGQGGTISSDYSHWNVKQISKEIAIAAYLKNAQDVSDSEAAHSEVLRWDSDTSMWRPGGAITTYLKNAQDVSDSEAAQGEVLRWDSDTSMWRPSVAIEAYLKDTADVSDSEAAHGEVLRWDSDTSMWRPGVAGSGVGGLAQYDPDENWLKDDARIYDDAIYLANTDKVGVSPAFAVAASGDDTWRPAGHAGLVTDNLNLFRNGGINLSVPLSTSVNFPFGSQTWTRTINDGGFTIGSEYITFPTAGTYEISLDFMFVAGDAAYSGGVLTYHQLNKTDSTGNSPVVIGGTELTVVQDSRENVSFKTTVTVEAGDRIYYNFNDGGIGPVTVSYYYFNFSATKKSGYIPAIGYEANTVAVRRVTSQTGMGDASRFVWDQVDVLEGLSYTPASGIVTLKAGVTYELQGSIGVSANLDQGNARQSGGFYDETNLAWIGSMQAVNSPTDGAFLASNPSPAHYTFTPSVDTDVSLRLRETLATSSQGSDNFASGFGGMPWMTIKAISKQLPVTKGVYTETITIRTTTNTLTKPTTMLVDEIVLVDDRTGWCNVDLHYAFTDVTGAVQASGNRLYKLPAGYKFDTSIHTLNTAATMTSSAGGFAYAGMANALPTATGYITNTIGNWGAIVAVPYTETEFRLGITDAASIGAWSYAGDTFAINDPHSARCSFRFKKA